MPCLQLAYDREVVMEKVEKWEWMAVRIRKALD